MVTFPFTVENLKSWDVVEEVLTVKSMQLEAASENIVHFHEPAGCSQSMYVTFYHVYC